VYWNNCIKWLILLCITLYATSGHAFDQLTEAQGWIYDRSHLSNTRTGQIVEYDYSSSNEINNSVEDVATLSITAEKPENRRDITVNFLTEDRHISLPDFTAYRGNPIVIAMLERVAQDLGQKTGGGVLYFRNRIRDSLASADVKLDNESLNFNNEPIEATTLTFFPFSNDAYLGSEPLLREARFTMSFSDDVPGSVVSIQILAESDDERFLRSLNIR